MSQQLIPPVNRYTGSYTEDTEGDGVRLNAFDHEDADIAFDPLSANRRFSGTADLAVLGTLVFAGPTRETISVMVPDCLMPLENNTVRVDLRHHVGLSLGAAVEMTNWSPEDHLDRALCPASLSDTLGLQRREYWAELNPILKRWKSVNKSNCPDCQKFIQINMGRHIRLKHTTYMCFWRCPVVSCSLWFTAELNAKDHIEGIHKFKESEGISFYECLRRHGIEWFGSRKFFEQRKETNPGLVDGYGAGAPIWPGITKFLRYYEQPGVRSFETVLQGGGRRFADGVRPFTSDVDPAQVATRADERGGGWLRRRVFGRQFDAAVAASRHTRGDISGGGIYGSRDAGRCFRRGHSSSGDASESPPTASRGRSIRGLHTTTY